MYYSTHCGDYRTVYVNINVIVIFKHYIHRLMCCIIITTCVWAYITHKTYSLHCLFLLLPVNQSKDTKRAPSRHNSNVFFCNFR